MRNRNFYLLLFVLICNLLQKANAQILNSPDGIIFQSVLTDIDGNQGKNKTVNVKSSIIQTSVNGNVVYSEVFQVVASENGVFSIVIGKGNRLSGPASISQLDWTAGPYFLNIKVGIATSENSNPNAIKYIDMGTTQFWSVPYALNAGYVPGLNLKLNTLDTANMLKNYLRKGNLALVATTGSYNDLIDKPVGQFSQVNSDWNATSGLGLILNKPSIPSAYSLPIASKTTLGGIKVGSNLNIDENGVLSTSNPGIPYTGATAAVNLGSYDLTVNGLTVGLGKGSNGTNTVIGSSALLNNTSGNNNTVTGNNTLYANSTGSFNTANGGNALYTNTIGSYNTAIGYGADVASNNLTNATAIGYGAVVSGNNSIRLGNDAITRVITAGQIKTGAIILPNTDGTSGQVLTTDGAGNVTWSNGGSNNNSNFVDLTTNQSISGNKRFVNDVNIGGLVVGMGGNIGNGNTRVGQYSLDSNVNGNANTAIGRYALNLNKSGNYNTAVGAQSLASNTIGYNNVAVGLSALNNNIGGYENTAIGSSALYQNTSGYDNVAVGNAALFTNSTGNYNVSLGLQSLMSNIDGNDNIAIGTSSLQFNTSGQGNVAIGKNALLLNSTGTNLTAIGNGAGYYTSNLTNATAIGNGAFASSSNTVQIGNSSVVTIGGQVGWTAASDIRLKKNITNTKYGLNTVMKLRPVEYNLKSNDLRQVGFIAQEVKMLVPEVVTGKEGDLNKGEILGISYANLIPVLTKAIQEQQKQIEDQNKKIERLEALVEKLSMGKK